MRLSWRRDKWWIRLEDWTNEAHRIRWPQDVRKWSVSRGIVPCEGIFFHVAASPTFLGQLLTFSTVNTEKLIVHLPSGTKFSSFRRYATCTVSVFFTLTTAINAFYYRHAAPKEIYLPRKIPLRISIFSSTRVRCWNIRGWTEGGSFIRLAIQKSRDYWAKNFFKKYPPLIPQTSNRTM